MKRKLVVLTLMIFFYSLSSAQSKYSIEVEVVGDNHTLWGNVLVLSPVDSTLIKGSYFEDGKVLIEDITETYVLLKFRSSGYLDTMIPVNSQGNNVNVGTIKMTPIINDIEGVDVVYVVPLFEPANDGTLNINVQKTILSASVSVMELLAKSPGVGCRLLCTPYLRTIDALIDLVRQKQIILSPVGGCFVAEDIQPKLLGCG